MPKGKRKHRKLPSIGAKFERKWRNALYRMRVVKEAGKAAFEVQGQVFASPSAAAKSVTKQEVNGWRFWHID
jgi:Protein of unknown function (DUF2924)